MRQLRSALDSRLLETRDSYRRVCEESKSGVFLYGAGFVGRWALSFMDSIGIPVLGFVDSDKSKWGTYFAGQRVFSPTDPEVIAAIAARRAPALGDAREQAVYDVASALLATGRVPQPLYDQGLSMLGERGMVELVGILGYYCLVALTLNAFELGLPGSLAPELEDPEHRA